MGVFAELARTRVGWTLYQTLPRSGKGLASQTIYSPGPDEQVSVENNLETELISIHHDDLDNLSSAPSNKNSSSSPCVTSPRLYGPPHKKHKPYNVDEAILDTLKSIQEHSDKKWNEDYHFSMQMYSTLKNLETRKKAMAKLHIH